VVVLMTASDRDEAERIATALVEERLAACVNTLGPVRSTYRWKGAVERADEILLIAKTRRALVARLSARVRGLHSYDVPEVIALPITAGSAPYLTWLAAETGPAKKPRRASARRR
jgi:periplasmic divalent cation tolerance protein